MTETDNLTLEVVIPAYNAESFIHETLYSLYMQSRPADIITVVNDRSTDRTIDIVNLAARDMADRVRIRVLENAGPRGPSAARNTAIRNSRSDIIALMDSDDLAEERHHEILISILKKCKNSVLSFGNSNVFHEKGIITRDMFQKSGISSQRYVEHPSGYRTLGERMFCLLTGSGVFTTSACAFRRQHAIEAGLFDEEMMYSEDTDFFMRLSLLGDFYFTDAIITRKRVHGNNLTNPKNNVFFARGSSYSLARIQEKSSSNVIHLTDAQKSALSESLHSTLFGYLYASSLTGLSAYREAIALAWRSGFPSLALDPRHFLRLCLRNVLGRPGRS
jgi:glycosyltransferase involved in cell wall biosynthesis